MCQSIADGGRRCFSHHQRGNINATDALKKIKALKLKKSKMSDEEYNKEYKRALIEYYTTEEGIEKLEKEGKFAQAEKFRSRRNRKIDDYNQATGKNQPHFGTYEERQAKLNAIHDAKGFHKKNGNHRATGTAYNEQGFNKFGVHQATGTRFNSDGYNADGYGVDGFHKETQLDSRGFGRDGFNPTTGRDSQGYGRDGYRNALGGTEVDRDGFQRSGFNNQGIHRNGTMFDNNGYDEEGYHKDTERHRDSGLTRKEQWQQSRSRHLGSDV